LSRTTGGTTGGTTARATARAALGLYAGLPLTTRAHVLLRWLSCPFPAVAAAVPMHGRILEIGCGHGLFAAYLSLGSGQRSVLGVDIDAAKISQARMAAGRGCARGADLRVDVGSAGHIPAGPWDAIVIVDVLYLLADEAQRSLLAGCARELAPGGVLVVKEMGTTPRWKHRWNVAQETLAVRVLRITAGGGQPFTFLAPPAIADVLRHEGLETSTTAVDRHRPHPHHVVVGRRGR